MPPIDSVLGSVLKKITPSEEENKAVHKVIEEVIESTKKIIHPYGLSVVLAGSFTRSTWLSHKKEFDLFIQFPVDTPREKLEKLGLEIGKKIVKSMNGSHVIAYAEHPYTRSKIKGYDVDIVPCYKVESAEKIMSAVDRTPFHNQYLSKKLHPHQSSDVRLLKTFCKVGGLYGSDLKTQGFSGYLCELLTIRFDSFKELIAQASNWLPGQVFVDLESKYKGDKKEFHNQPLIIIDPVDPKRNVAAALSPAVFVKFSELCKSFLKSPSEKFFFNQDEKIKKAQIASKLKSRGTLFIGVKFSRPRADGNRKNRLQPPIVDDIIYPQIRKTAKRLAEILKEHEFSVLGQTVWTDSNTCLIILEIENWSLPNIRRVIGPPVFAVNNAHEFAEKYRKLGRVWIEEDRWVAETPRKFKVAIKKLADSLNETSNVLKAKGIASYMADSIAKGFKLLTAKDLLKTDNQDLLKTIKIYLEEDV